jgi:hypothetical protein
MQLPMIIKYSICANKEHNGLWNCFCTRTSRHDKSSVKENITNIILQDFGKDDVKERLKVD